MKGQHENMESFWQYLFLVLYTVAILQFLFLEKTQLEINDFYLSNVFHVGAMLMWAHSRIIEQITAILLGRQTPQ